nr:unnamed protein product [Digitaria exilis]
MAPVLQRFTDIAGDGAPRLDAASGEELVRVDRAASVALGRRSPEPPGTLFITTRRVIWLSEAEKGKGYAVDFLAISLHAVSRDLEAYPSPCLYTQIEAEVGTDEEAEHNGENGWFHGEDMADGGWLQINDQRFEDADEDQESHENGH